MKQRKTKQDAGREEVQCQNKGTGQREKRRDEMKNVKENKGLTEI